MIKRIHVNQHIIRSNKKNGMREDPITVKMGGKSHTTSFLEIRDKDGDVVVKVIYSPDKPMDCGAVVWIETLADVLFVPKKKTPESV